MYYSEYYSSFTCSEVRTYKYILDILFIKTLLLQGSRIDDSSHWYQALLFFSLVRSSRQNLYSLVIQRRVGWYQLQLSPAASKQLYYRNLITLQLRVVGCRLSKHSLKQSAEDLSERAFGPIINYSKAK